VIKTLLDEDEKSPDDSSSDSSWDKSETETPIFQVPYRSESTADTIRKTGLAWSAGIVFFGSVVFMLILGWFADLLLGTRPWALVIGIVLGSVIGFIQFFRITSQILKTQEKKSETKTFLSPDDGKN
jgi:F0F1-type ATP synthase assembly protein I